MKEFKVGQKVWLKNGVIAVNECEITEVNALGFSHCYRVNCPERRMANHCEMVHNLFKTKDEAIDAVEEDCRFGLDWVRRQRETEALK